MDITTQEQTQLLAAPSDTEVRLIAVHGGVSIPLDKVAERYLGLSPEIARRQAVLQQLPFPTYRLSGSRKAPLMVSAKALAAHIDRIDRKATEEWKRSQV